jgi:AP-2 complex subunit alpha
VALVGTNISEECVTSIIRMKIIGQLGTLAVIISIHDHCRKNIKSQMYILFSDAPSMNITFIYNNVPQKLTIKLPLTINKFFEPTEMNGESFFARWKNLGG